LKGEEIISGIVYSTTHGRMCPTCSKPIATCVCRQKKSTLKGDGIVRVGRETRGRKGKGVTVITGVPLDAMELKVLGKQLKARCGAGGAVHDGVIEIQGDHREVLLEELRKRGWTVKRAGG
jgi:translation initiation factor 1